MESSNGAGTTGRKKSMEAPLRELFKGAADLVELAGDDYCSGIIRDRADHLAKAWGKLAKRNDTVYRILLTLTSTSEWGEAVMITLATAVPIAAHHGWLPEEAAMLSTMGFVVPPSQEVADAEAAAAETPPAPEREPEPPMPPSPPGGMADVEHEARITPPDDEPESGDGDGRP